MRLLLGLAIGTSLSAAALQMESRVLAHAGQLTPAEQQMVDRQLAAPKLDPQAIVATIELAQTSVGDILGAIAKAIGISVRYHSSISSLGALTSAKLSNVDVEAALHTVLDSRSLVFKATGPRSVFVYPDTPQNREKYTESIRTFPVAHADVNALSTIINRAITPIGADDLRPTVVTTRASRSVIVRATPEMMARIAKVIADNDKH